MGRRVEARRSSAASHCSVRLLSSHLPAKDKIKRLLLRLFLLKIGNHQHPYDNPHGVRRLRLPRPQLPLT